MGFRSAKLGSSVQSSLQSRWKNPRSLILVNSLVVVFKSPCPDFQNLAWLRNQLSKLLSPAVEQCCCSSSSAAAAWSDARVAVTQAFSQNKRSGSHATVPLIKRGAERKRRETQRHTARRLSAQMAVRTFYTRIDEQEQHRTTDRCSSPFTQSTVIH